MDQKNILKLIYPIIKNLAEKNYQQLRKNNNMGRLSQEEIERTLKEYGGHITLPREEDIKYIYFYPSREKEYIAEIYLWIDNKESDLTLTLRLSKNKQGSFLASIENLRVL